MRESLKHAAPLPCECFILKCAFLEILRRLSNNSFHMQSSIRFTQKNSHWRKRGPTYILPAPYMHKNHGETGLSR